MSFGNFEGAIEAIVFGRFHRFQFLRIHFDRLPSVQLRIDRIAKLDPFGLVELGLGDSLEGLGQSLDCVWSRKSVKLKQTFAFALVKFVDLEKDHIILLVRSYARSSVVRVWVFWIRCSSPFQSKQLGCDVTKSVRSKT